MARWPTFWGKAVLAVALVALADALVFEIAPGAGFGLFLLAWVAALAIGVPAIRRCPLGIVALAAAGLLAALQIERASLLAALLFVLAVGVAALAPRMGAGRDVLHWALRLPLAGLRAIIDPFRDVGLIARARARRDTWRIGGLLLAAVVPVVGGALFLALFSAANPVISEILGRLRLPQIDPGRVIFWGVVAFAVRTSLRGRTFHRLPVPQPKELSVPGVTTASVVASLALFNLIFAVQNGLDVAFLWSGAALPEGMSFAEYAHRGAYPLIATALLAGLFVLVFLRPGSATAARPAVRILVTAWVAQNLFLVASTALRTIDYVDAYSLTRLRIAALLWMALVATGLVLICWRLLANKSAGWLVNANAIALAVVLGVCSVVDLGSIAAGWNVRHAREVGGRGAPLDLCYLRDLGGAAVVPLSEIERGPYDPAFKDRVAFTRRLLMARMARPLGDWRSWRWRDARRLRWVEAYIYETPAWPDIHARDCQGRPLLVHPAPLTPPPNPGT
jgi:hypothetical protein